MYELVSVIIPTWNRARGLEKAIISVIDQTYRQIEILICDDGSTDNSLEIVTKLQKKYPAIVWVPGAHFGGPARARNRGLKHAKGEWVAFLDSDDRWVSTKIMNQINFAKKYNLSFVSTNAVKIVSGQKARYLPGLSDSQDYTFTDLLQNNHIICSSVLVKKSIIDQVDGFPEDSRFIAVEDYVAWLKISLITRIGYLSEPLVEYLDSPKETIRNRWLNSTQQMNIIVPHLVGWYFAHVKFTVRYLSAIVPLMISRLKYN